MGSADQTSHHIHITQSTNPGKATLGRDGTKTFRSKGKRAYAQNTLIDYLNFPLVLDAIVLLFW